MEIRPSRLSSDPTVPTLNEPRNIENISSISNNSNVESIRLISASLSSGSGGTIADLFIVRTLLDQLVSLVSRDNSTATDRLVSGGEDYGRVGIDTGTPSLASEQSHPVSLISKNTDVEPAPLIPLNFDCSNATINLKPGVSARTANSASNKLSILVHDKQSELRRKNIESVCSTQLCHKSGQSVQFLNLQISCAKSHATSYLPHEASPCAYYQPRQLFTNGNRSQVTSLDSSSSTKTSFHRVCPVQTVQMRKPSRDSSGASLAHACTSRAVVKRCYSHKKRAMFLDPTAVRSALVTNEVGHAARHKVPSAARFQRMTNWLQLKSGYSQSCVSSSCQFNPTKAPQAVPVLPQSSDDKSTGYTQTSVSSSVSFKSSTTEAVLSQSSVIKSAFHSHNSVDLCTFSKSKPKCHGKRPLQSWPDNNFCLPRSNIKPTEYPNCLHGVSTPADFPQLFQTEVRSTNCYQPLNQCPTTIPTKLTCSQYTSEPTVQKPPATTAPESGDDYYAPSLNDGVVSTAVSSSSAMLPPHTNAVPQSKQNYKHRSSRDFNLSSGLGVVSSVSSNYVQNHVSSSSSGLYEGEAPITHICRKLLSEESTAGIQQKQQTPIMPKTAVGRHNTLEQVVEYYGSKNNLTQEEKSVVRCILGMQISNTLPPFPPATVIGKVYEKPIPGWKLDSRSTSNSTSTVSRSNKTRKRVQSESLDGTKETGKRKRKRKRNNKENISPNTAAEITKESATRTKQRKPNNNITNTERKSEIASEEIDCEEQHPLLYDIYQLRRVIRDDCGSMVKTNFSHYNIHVDMPETEVSESELAPPAPFPRSNSVKSVPSASHHGIQRDNGCRVRGSKYGNSANFPPTPARISSAKHNGEYTIAHNSEDSAALTVPRDAVGFQVDYLPGVVVEHLPFYPSLYRDEPRIPPPRRNSRGGHGCRRAAPYKGRSASDMFSFLASKHRPPPTLRSTQKHDEAQPSNRRAMSLDDHPMPMRFRYLRTARKAGIGVYRSPIHGRGLFCKRDYDPDEMIVEYTGQVVRKQLCDKREKAYESRGIGCYMFTMDGEQVVDATVMGNGARFINHSCAPNCYSRIVSFDGTKRIVIFALRKIRRGEELTYDYKFPIEGDEHKISCRCGVTTCRKFLN